MPMKVAIVEDEIRIREGIEKLLKKLNRDYEIVAVAENGDDGLKLIRETKPDIVITDICMPVMDGLEMLKRMTSEGLHAKAVVLSAYSDFEYARSAMKYGVTEYLLKPTSLMDFEQAMAHVEEQVMLDRSRKPAEIGSIDQVFRDLLLGRMKATPELESYLNNNYGIRSDSRFTLILCCPGSPFEEKTREYGSRLGRVLPLFSQCRFVTVDFSYRKVLATVAYDYAGPGGVQSILQSRLDDLGPVAAVCCAETTGPFSLHDAYEKMFPYLDWNIAQGGRTVIRWPEVAQVKTESCIYPMELENRMRAAMYASNADEIAAVLREFGACFRDGKVYQPREIKECYVRFLWLIISFAKETGGNPDQTVDRQKLLTEIMDAKTREELERQRIAPDRAEGHRTDPGILPGRYHPRRDQPPAPGDAGIPRNALPPRGRHVLQHLHPQRPDRQGEGTALRNAAEAVRNRGKDGLFRSEVLQQGFPGGDRAHARRIPEERPGFALIPARSRFTAYRWSVFFANDF